MSVYAGGGVVVAALLFVVPALPAGCDGEYSVLYCGILGSIELLLVVSPAVGDVIAVVVEFPVSQLV